MSIVTGGPAAALSETNVRGAGASQSDGSYSFGLNNQAVNQILAIIKQLEGLLQQVSTRYGDQTGGKDYRSVDGAGNNLMNPDWGSAGSALFRSMDAAYTNGQSSMAGQDRPNARAISNTVMSQTTDTQARNGASDLFWQWGQFVDHDITKVENNDGAARNIAVPKGDPVFDPMGTGQVSIPFNRSNGELVDGVYQQTNDITSYIDASMVYGSDKETADNLRSFSGGRMRMDANGMLPTDERGFFEAGDSRVNEQPGLTSMHTLFVREHNYQADKLASENPSWSDEKIYQEARAIVSAQIQHITYNEFLPMLVGQNALGAYQGYDPSVNASVSNEFATAAFRFGHTMLSPTLKLIDGNGNTTPQGDLALKDAFMNPSHVKENGVDPIIRGQAEQVAQALDPMIIDDVRNTLFGPPGAGGMDLAALNIQRGRDHGLPSWNDTREALGLERIETFDHPVFQSDFGQKLAQVYDHPDEVDLWVGGLAEKPAHDAMVGETFQNILVDQFQRLRSGDRYWHENTMSQAQLSEIKNTSLSDIIERNTNVDMADDTAMIATDSPTNGYVPKPSPSLENLLNQVADVLRQIASQLGNYRYS